MFLAFLFLATSLIGADDVTFATSTLQLKGIVAPKSLLDINQLVGSSPGAGNAIPLDSGDILYDAIGDGIKVGQWSVSSNTNAQLSLHINYDEFTDPLMAGVSIPYKVSNGTSWIDSGALFKTLVKVGGNGIYKAEDNTGPIMIKRTDTNLYPPSVDYMTTISFTLLSE